jgi:predicted  nucleic acid-binding Zn-ribbon protein
MEERKYEAGRVEISSTEYRDLVREAVEARRDASDCRSEKWKVENERDALKKELELAMKKIAELESVISNLQVARTIPTYPLDYQFPPLSKQEVK